jgi:hypothetical protein
MNSFLTYVLLFLAVEVIGSLGKLGKAACINN